MNLPARPLACLAAVPLLLAGCAPSIIGGTVIGAPSNIDERAAGQQLDDRVIETTIDQRLASRFGTDGRARWKLASFDRRVVLVGQAPDEASRAEMGRIARSVEQVAALDEEIVVAPPPPAESRAADLAVAANVRRRLMNDAGARFTSLKVLVDGGVVHLVGRVTAQESRIAEFIARDTGGVRRVVTHWEMRP